VFLFVCKSVTKTFRPICFFLFFVFVETDGNIALAICPASGHIPGHPRCKNTLGSLTNLAHTRKRTSSQCFRYSFIIYCFYAFRKQTKKTSKKIIPKEQGNNYDHAELSSEDHSLSGVAAPQK